MNKLEIKTQENQIKESSKYQLKDFEIKSLDIDNSYQNNKYSYLEKFNDIYSEEKLKLRNIYFLKMSLKEIKQKIKDAYKIYNFTKKDTNGLILGIVIKKKVDYDLIIVSPNIIKFPKNSSYLLSYYNQSFNLRFVQKIIMTNVNTDEVVDMSFLFNDLENLTSLDLSSFNTKNVTTMEGMFDSCIKLKSINLSTFNTKNVATMERMFESCTALKSINLSSFNTKKVESFTEMFFDCISLQELDLKNLSTNKVADFDCMFSGCESLKKLILTNLDIRKANTIYGMLDYCFNLAYIDMSNIHEKTIIEKEKDDYLFRSIKIDAKIILKGFVNWDEYK